MLRPVFILRVVALVSLFYALYVIRCQYLFQQYLRTRLITSGDFPPLYVEALNDSVAHGKQPLDFDYASTFTKPEIPRIIHFIWFQNLYPTHDGASQIPTSSSRAPELCREFNPEFEVRIWDATMARTFLEKEYSWFLPTYDGYRYPIQRVDALKYFALYHYGGVYMDLDISCRRPLDPLLSFPAWFPEASPLGVNNDLMAARAGHPILELMTAELKRRDKNWLFPYLTIFWSTGPQFSSDVLKKWVEYERFHRAESTDPRKSFKIPMHSRTKLISVIIAQVLTLSSYSRKSTIRSNTRSLDIVLEALGTAEMSRWCCGSSIDLGCCWPSLSYLLPSL
jgi:mannosyltransferase OCH1-like enzyme